MHLDTQAAKARGYNMLDVEISRSTWKAREGARVRQYVGQYSRPADDEIEEMIRLVKSLSSMVLCADMIGRAVAKYRHVYSSRMDRRQATATQLLSIFQQMQENGWGEVEQADNGWPVFKKFDLAAMDGNARKKITEAQLPTFLWQRFPQAPRQKPHKGSEQSIEHSPSVPIAQATPQANTKPESARVDPKPPFEAPARESRRRENQPERPPVSLPENAAPPQGSASKQEKVQGRQQAETQKREKDENARKNATDEVESQSEKEEEEEKKERSDEPWERAFEEKMQMPMVYERLREVVEMKLGEAKDPGIYTCKDKSRNSNRIELRANCREGACLECTKQVKATLDKKHMPPLVTIHVRGCHGQLQKPAGGTLLNVAEQYAIKEWCVEQDLVGVKDIRHALKRAGLAVRMTPQQLSNYATRLRAQGAGGGKKTGTLVVADLEAAMHKFLLTAGDNLLRMPRAQLVILPESIVREDQVCIVWTCAGMLLKAQSGQNKILKLVVDGKQNVVANSYTVVTLAFLVHGQTASKTWASTRRNKSVDCFTSTQLPFLQALVNSESEANLTHIFEVATQVGTQYCKLNLPLQVVQVHKDYAKGIEASRKKVFRNARPCDDFAHMRRAAYSSLRAFFRVLGRKQKSRRPQCANTTEPLDAQIFCKCVVYMLYMGCSFNLTHGYEAKE